MRKLKIFSSLLVISTLLLMPIARLNAKAAIVGQSTSVQTIKHSAPPLTLNSAQGSIGFELFAESTTITTDEYGLKTVEIIMGYKFDANTEGFVSITVLPDGSTINNDSNFMAEIEARNLELNFLLLNAIFGIVATGEDIDITPNGIGNPGDIALDGVLQDIWDWISGAYTWCKDFYDEHVCAFKSVSLVIAVCTGNPISTLWAGYGLASNDCDDLIWW